MVRKDEKWNDENFTVKEIEKKIGLEIAVIATAATVK